MKNGIKGFVMETENSNITEKPKEGNESKAHMAFCELVFSGVLLLWFTINFRR